ncbi:type IV pilus secretin PilQ [Geomonas sp.]|uniref:type IV pilus secretin PilQ n=1 Tax=Geomonas sp. TaxID=2651584 RepID=UPI002B488E5C|nr:type IV pilus secretin PilQ [Geomonas sp.]
MALIALVASCSGCVKRMSAVNEPSQAGASAFATLRTVNVSADANRIELVSDKPLTYTSYKAGEPAKIVIDISQTEPGPVASPIEVNRGNVRRIDVVRQALGGGVLTRVEIALVKDTDFTASTAPADRSKLEIALAPVVSESKPSQPAAKQATAGGKEAPLSEQRIEEKTLVADAAPGALPAVPAKAKPEAATAPVKADKAADQQVKSAESTGGKWKAEISGPRVNAILITRDGVEVSVAGGIPQTFNSFKLSKPDRIVVDMFGVKSALEKNVVPIGAFGVASARVGTTADKLRVVLDASGDKLPAYEVVKSDLGLKIRLKGEAAAQSAPAKPATQSAQAATGAKSVPATARGAAGSETVAASAPPVPAPAAVKSEVPRPRQSKGALEAVDFKVVDGFSRITIKMFGTCEASQPVRGPQGISLSIANCQVPKNLQRALDTGKFGSPVLSVTPYQVKVKGAPVAKLLVRVKGTPHFSMSRRGEVVVLDVANPVPPVAAKLPPAPAAKAPAAAEGRVAEELVVQPRGADQATELPIPDHARPVRKVYTGRRVTLEFSDADIRKIFQLIAEVSNLNFLISDDVSGTISLKLVNVPWDQALDVILDAKGLGMQREGNIVQIKPKSKLQTQAQEEAAAKRAVEATLPLRTMIFEVNFATIGDIATQFQALKSERGTIIRDERTNRVIVTDIQPALDAMRQLLKNLDIPEKQVMIEARIVEATSSFTRDLGVQWEMHYKDGSASFANINSVDSTFGGVVSSAGPGSTGAGGIGMGMSFGKLNSNIQVDMRLSAAATIGEVKIVSTPKVVTLNNKAAKISQGQSIPYQTTSAEGTKTEFVEAALTLEVTPHITADGSVSMKIKASNNSPGTGSPPPINKKEATTELLVANGETTVIGGIYQDNETETDTGIPFLADIPLLGWLFKSNSKLKTKTELLIFITPKVVI